MGAAVWTADILGNRSGVRLDFGRMQNILRKDRNQTQGERCWGTHTRMVERHHSILRSCYLRLAAQAKEEGIEAPENHLLTLAVTAKNALFSIGGVSPTQALFGRQPAVLPDIERVLSTLDDTNAGPDGLSRGRHRLQEMAAQTMIEHTARNRIELALKSKTRPATQSHQYRVGEEVEVYRQPAQKEMSGWRGPAEILKVEDDGAIRVTWQGGSLLCRPQDVRRALLYAAFLYFYLQATHGPTLYDPFSILRDHVMGMRLGVPALFAITLQEGKYYISHAATNNNRIFHATLAVANALHLEGCTGARVGRGIHRLDPVRNIDDS